LLVVLSTECWRNDGWLSLKTAETTTGVGWDLTLAVYRHLTDKAIWTTPVATVTFSSSPIGPQTGCGTANRFHRLS